VNTATRAVVSVAAVTAAVVASTALSASAHGSQGAGTGAGVPPRLLAEVRAATASFHDPAKATAAGYLPSSHCEPGMGQHWVNMANLLDGVSDPRRPDILLYEPTPAGARLVGVEWLQFDADQDLGTDDDRPDLAGVPFDGPMLGHEPGMPIHYDLHLYVWKHNPDGVAAPFNPRVSC
jgi:hypothetical protein